MAITLKILFTIMVFFSLCGVQGIFPSSSLAARVAGEDVPVPAVTATPSPPVAPLPEKHQEKKNTPLVFPQTLQKKDTAAPAPIKSPVPEIKQGPEIPLADKAPAAVPGPVAPTPPRQPLAERVKPPKILKEPSTPPVSAAPPDIQKATKKPVKDARYVTIDFDNVDIQVFVKFVSELTGKNFVIDEKVRGKVTIISPRKISLDEVYKVFESVLEVYGFATVTAGEVIKIVPSLQAREKQLETRLGEQAQGSEDKLITQIISLENANPDEIKRVLDPLISRSSILVSYAPTGMLVITDYQSNIQKIMEIVSALDVEGMASQITYLPLKVASATDIAKSLTVLFQPQTGKSPSPLRIVADDRANALILVASEMETDRIKKLIEFMDKEVPLGAAALRIYRLQNAVAEDLAKVLMNIPKATTSAPGAAVAVGGKSLLLSKDVQIVADKATNTLIITANNDDYKILEDVIKSLDIARPMVFIEALIMEVNTTKNFQVGVEWQLLKDIGNSAVRGLGDVAPNDPRGLGVAGFKGNMSVIPQVTASGVSIASGLSLGVVGAGIQIGGVKFPNIGAVLNAYQSDADVSILSNPQIMTLDNEEAEINVGQNVPYITRQDTSSSITQTAGGINYSSYEYKDVGVVLNITPHINEDNFVRLKLNQKVSSVVSGVDTGRPTTLKREAKTVVVVKDKETIVIGGMLGDSTNEGTGKVPCLGNLPLLGWLFKSYNKAREKTNLYVFITPHIVRTQSDADALYQNKREQMGSVVDGVIKLDKLMKKEPVRN